MDFAPPSVRDAFARLRSMASASSYSSNSGGGDDEEASVLILPDSSSSTATTLASSSSSANGGGGAQLRGGGGASGAGQQQQQEQRLPVSTVGSINVAVKGGLLASAFPPAAPPPPQEKPSPSSFLPPPLSPARASSSSVAASSLVGSVAAFFGKPFSSSKSSSARRRQAKTSFSSSPLLFSSSSSSLSLFSRDSVLTFLVVAAWYAANTGILLMNRALLSDFGFRRPLLLTLLHMGACAVLGRLCEPWEASLEGAGRDSASSSSSSFDDRVSEKEKEAANATAAQTPPPLSAAAPSSSSSSSAGGPARAKVAVLAATFCAAVVLGNVSLRFIPVSFAQAIGSTTPAFTAALAFVLLGAREPAAVYATLLPVVGGVVLASGFEPSFDAVGFGTAVAATAARALKAVLQGALLGGGNDPSSKDQQRVGSMALLRLMAPVAAAMLLPATLLLEPGGLAATAAACRRSPGFAFFLFANAALSYAVNLTNFIVTKRTSPLTLHVLGNAKGVFATVVSVAVFRNPVSGVGALGYLSAVAGTLLYGFLKSSSAKKQRQVQQQLQQQLLGRSSERRGDESGVVAAKAWGDAAVAKVGGAFQALSASSNVDGAIRIKAVAA